jgi:hypothetical protein
MQPRAAAQLFRSLPLGDVRVPPELDAQFRREFGARRTGKASKQLSDRIDRFKTDMRPIAQDLGVGEEEVLAVDFLVAIPDKQQMLWADRSHPIDFFPLPETRPGGDRALPAPREDGDSDGHDRDPEWDDSVGESAPIKEIEEDDGDATE